MDSHADTHCFGRNFRPISWTGHECSVAPFLAEYSEQVHIPICTGITTYTLDSGEVVILLFRQGLWFGNRMEKSLINPYQCEWKDGSVSWVPLKDMKESYPVQLTEYAIANNIEEEPALSGGSRIHCESATGLYQK